MAGVSTPTPDASAPKRKAKVPRKHTVARVMVASTLGGNISLKVKVAKSQPDDPGAAREGI